MKLAAAILAVAQRFNPLHCGAVVASHGRRMAGVAGSRFQSPSLRGSGRFRPPYGGRGGKQPGFNPLHCGAVVASLPEPSGSARTPIVSIPFIAGQWSLQMELIAAVALAVASFNPLHCGAVVASARRTRRMAGSGGFQSPSLRGSGRFQTTPTFMESGSPCFNPLHCGAVVASGWRLVVCDEKRFVSIPFIAGQWSLPTEPGLGGAGLHEFQSPSLRGSGRFTLGIPNSQ